MKKSAVIFLVNSLCNGGAERVVVNMANEYAKENDVFIITLYNSKTYKIDNKIHLISLYKEKLSRYNKILKLPSIVRKVNKIISDIKKKYDLNAVSPFPIIGLSKNKFLAYDQNLNLCIILILLLITLILKNIIINGIVIADIIKTKLAIFNIFLGIK